MPQKKIKTSPVQAWLAQRTGLGPELNPRRLEQYQLSKLRELLDYVQARSSFYRDKLGGVGSTALESLDGLAGLPFLTADELRSEGERMICIPQSRVARVITVSTSGTGGRPKRLYFSEPDLELCIDFFAHGMQTMVESGGLVEIRLPGNNPEPQMGPYSAEGPWRNCSSGNGPQSPSAYGVVDLLRTGLERIEVKSVWRDPAGPREAPVGDCLVGMAADLHQLALSYPEARPKSVLLCADYVPEAVIETLKRTWGAEVFTHYGSTESGQGGGVECAAHDGYHLREADLLIEIIDPLTGAPVPPGRSGEIVLTTLSRQAMPLIRYRTGDRACRLEHPCACGSNLPRLGKVTGRYDHELRLKSGAFISIHRLDEIMFRFPEVLDYRAALNADRDSLDLQIRPHSAAPDQAAVTEKIRALIDPSLQINISIDRRRPSPPAKRTLGQGA